MAQGLVVGLLAGPPCETWSVVRFQALEGRSGPRPLRLREAPWGVRGLSAQEQKQVNVGNLLLRTTMRFLAAAVVSNVCAVMEHPICPSWEPRAASSWRLEEMAWIKSWPGVAAYGAEPVLL